MLKMAFFILKNTMQAFNLTLMRTVTQQQKKGQNIWQHPFETKKKHYFQQMQVACGFDKNIYLM